MHSPDEVVEHDDGKFNDAFTSLVSPRLNTHPSLMLALQPIEEAEDVSSEEDEMLKLELITHQTNNGDVNGDVFSEADSKVSIVTPLSKTNNAATGKS